MPTFRPKYITFDCYGTLINFDMAGAARRVYGSRLSPAAMTEFINNFSAYRLDEVLGAWKPYVEVVHNSRGAHLQAQRRRLPPGRRPTHL